MSAAIYPPAALPSPCVPTAGIKVDGRAAAWGITLYSNTATGGSSQGWISPCDTPGESSVQAAPGFQGMQAGHLAGNFVLCCCPRCFLCQQSSYFWLSQVSHECPAWAVCVKWHLHGPISLNWAELVMQLRFGKEKYIQESWFLGLKGDALQSIALGNSLWPFCWGELCFFPLQIHVCIMNKDVSSFAASSKLLCH